MADSSDAFPPFPAALPPKRSIRQKTTAGALAGLRLLWMLVKVVVPVSMLVEALRLSGALAALGNFLSPVMALWGLPGEAALAALGGTALNLYAAAAAMKPMQLDWQQVTVLGLGLGFAHSLPPEMAVLRQAGVPWKKLLAMRLAAAALMSLALHWMLVLRERLT